MIQKFGPVFRQYAAVVLIIPFLCALLGSQPAHREQVGPLPDGGFRLVTGWRLAPVGKQVPVDTLPMSSVVTPDGKYLLVLNCGYRPPSITVIETATAAVKSSVPVPDAWLGIAITPRGDRVYVGGGSKASIFEFALADGVLTPARTFPIVPEASRTFRDFIGDVTFSPDAHLLYASDLYHDSVVVVNPQSGIVISRIKTGRRPYRILFNPDGKSIYVSNWADGNVSQYDVNNGDRLNIIRIGLHPSDMIWRDGGPQQPAEGEPNYKARLFVAAANTNNVYAVGIAPGSTPEVIETINLAMTPRQPLGMTPSGLGLSPDKSTLYVACSDANVVGVADISGGRTRVEGFIPAGWYPTAVRTLPGGQLVVLNGKGLKSYPNPEGPSPKRVVEPLHKGVANQYFVGRMQTGTVSWIEPFNNQQLVAWTKEALADSLYSDSKLDEHPALPPVQHVIYIVKENRTYDQVLGDMKEGNGDASLCLFDENSTPNLHKIAREFVLLDNFYVNADVSADGHNWSTAAIAPDYVQKLWPNSYAGRRKGTERESEYDYEEQDPASIPPAGYLWSNANAAGLSLRNFGYMVNNSAAPAALGADQITTVRDPVLAKVTNRAYRGFDLNYKDVDRAQVFLKEFAGYERSGQMPQLVVMRMGNDHTNGTAAGKKSPIAYAADNDQGIGMVVEAVSKSKFWTSTAIFIVEDDAQNGPDHVDSHRSPAYVVSSFIKRHTVDSTMYNTTSLLRTMELMLGLHPMTQFDASAPVITAPFQQTPDPAPFTLEKARVNMDEVNPPNAPGAKESGKMDFAEADDVDEDLLNRILWRSIKGDAPMPAPVRSYFGK